MNPNQPQPNAQSNASALAEQLQELTGDSQISDFHIKEGEPLWRRRDGELQKAGTGAAITREQILELIRRNESHTGIKAAQLTESMQATGDRDMALKIGPRRFRANVYWCNGLRLAVTLRQLPEQAPLLKTLGLAPSYLNLLKSSKGLILVTGATGSGKTTTLASTLEHLNEVTSGHIITLEDPVEYLIRSRNCLVDQRQLGRDVPTFQSGLRSALRQDPDILLVGELRDYETVKTALDAANTGHLVLGTLHTNSAQQTLERLTSFFPDESRSWAHAVISQVLLGVLSQVLVPRADGTGRIMVAETLVNTSDVRQLIREGKSHTIFNAMDTGSSRGQHLLNKELLRLVRNNTIRPDDALYATYDPTNLSKELNRVN